MRLKTLLITLILGIIVLSGCSTDTSKNEDSTSKEDEKQQEVEIAEEEVIDDEDNISNEAENENLNTLYTTFEGISFELPDYAQFMETEDTGYPMELYMLDSLSGTNFNVLLEQLPEPIRLEEYIDVATSGTGFDYLSNDYYSVNCVEWNEAISKNDQGVQLNQRTFIIEDQVYIFTYGSTPENYENYIDVFKEITNSVTINE